MFEEQIDNGIRWLDTKRGIGWEHDVDLPSLNLSDCWTCVLGQLYGDERGTDESGYAKSGYDHACELWDWCDFSETPNEYSTDHYGFSCVSFYRELTEEWKVAILALRSANRTVVEELVTISGESY
jgi:hypothetical protein